jgi:FAD/FMN-containing dehydrogenase
MHVVFVVWVSEEDLDVVVQPGVSYEDLNRHLRDLSSSSSSSASSPHTLFFPVDPG